jgi:hypothetical protein
MLGAISAFAFAYVRVMTVNHPVNLQNASLPIQESQLKPDLNLVSVFLSHLLKIPFILVAMYNM